MSRYVTLADVARKSKVSLSTVSLVLRGKPGIPEATCQRVWEAAQALGYKRRSGSGRHSSGGGWPLGKLHTIGLIVKAEPGTIPQANPFYSHVLAGIEAACRQGNINLLYATLPVDENNVAVETPRMLEEDSADGLLLVGAFADATLTAVLGRRSCPVVLVDAYSSVNGYDAVLSDNVGGARRAVQYLIERGHRHIGLIAGHPHAYPSLSERREGYLQALQMAGITETYFTDCPLNPQAAAEATIQLLQRQPQITALFGCNDEVAIAAMRAAQSLGRRIPENLSVIGFDDIDLAQHVTPPLTTMHVDKAGMGRMAVQLLGNRIEFPSAERVTTLICPRLIERESVAAC